MRTWNLSGLLQAFATSKLAAHDCAIEAYLTASLALDRPTEALKLAILQLSLDYRCDFQILGFENGSTLSWSVFFFIFALDNRIFQHTSDSIERFSDLVYVQEA